MAPQPVPGLATEASDQLTVIITTSPTPSAPSTELLDVILQSYRSYCPILLGCRFIVVIDTYDRIGPHARLKKGQVTAEGAKALELYKSNVKELILRALGLDREGDDTCSALHQGRGEAEYGCGETKSNYIAFCTTHTEDKRVTFVEPDKRLGFGLAVRTALRLAETPYVWVQQHDWMLASEIPLGPIVSIMAASVSDDVVPVQYVCFPSIRMLSYATSSHVMNFPALRALTTSLKRDFVPNPASRPDVKVPLTPLFFWHDKPHVASTAHYLSTVFPTRLSLPKGAFIEDTIGQRARDQMKQGVFAKWACWLYYPEEGTRLCLRHLQGRTWRGAEAELLHKETWKKLNASRDTPCQD